MTKAQQVAWAAGLFEGEGTWLTRKGGSQAALGSTDKDVVERFFAIVGMGRIRLHEVRIKNENGIVAPGHYKDRHTWSVTNARDVRALIEMFWPYLGDRRRARAQEILDATTQVRSSRYATHCKRGHELTEENTYQQRNPASPKGWTRSCRACIRIRAASRSTA